MDFLDPRKRRSHTIRLFIGYALVGLALLIGTGFLGLYTYGFDLNQKTGTIIQNGLVFVDAHPDTADIYLNGQLKGKTSSRLVIAEGQYNVELRRTGYRTWKKQFSLEGSQIQRFVYPFLFPDKLISKDVELYSTPPGLVTESPDRHWLIAQKAGSLTDFELYDLTTATNDPTTLSLPASLFTSTTGTSLELVEWSNDNRHVVLKRSYNGGTEYILVDRETPTASQNLTKLLARPAVQVSLRDKKYDQYYLFDPAAATLSSVDLKTPVAITPILDRALAFKSYGADTIVYATDSSEPDGKELVRIRSGQETYTLREIAKGDIQLVDIARFDNHWYVAAGSSSEGKVYIFRDPVEIIKRSPKQPPAPVAALRQDNPRFVSFSTNVRFIAVQSGSGFAVYDAEDIRLLHYNTKLALPATYKATWMDGHRLAAVADGKLRVFDFDGTNMQTLNAANADYMPFFDRDYKALFTLSPSVTVAGRTALVRTELKVTP